MLPDPFRLTTVPRIQQFSFLILSWQQLIAFRDACQRMFKCLDCCTRNQWSFCKNQGHLRDNTPFVHPSCTHLSFLPYTGLWNLENRGLCWVLRSNVKCWMQSIDWWNRRSRTCQNMSKGLRKKRVTWSRLKAGSAGCVDFLIALHSWHFTVYS